jgi:hypothetical protein
MKWHVAGYSGLLPSRMPSIMGSPPSAPTPGPGSRLLPVTPTALGRAAQVFAEAHDAAGLYPSALSSLGAS